MKRGLSRELPGQMNRKIGKVMHEYSMLSEGDRVLVAVSGGIDSLFLLWLLKMWREKAPISYAVEAVHVDMQGTKQEPGPVSGQITEQVNEVGFTLGILPARWKPDSADLSAGKDLCFFCARERRNRLFSHARDHGFTKLALGHHLDDIIETFFLNLTCSGNISTMRPCQELFNGNLSVIRPLAYLEKIEIEKTAKQLGLQAVKSTCPLGDQTRRRDINELMQEIYARFPGAKKQIFAALGNVRQDYLLNPGKANTSLQKELEYEP